MRTSKLFWLAVQPTPYNTYLYNALKKVYGKDIQICYSMRIYKDLPWTEKIYQADDYFLSPFLGIDWSVLIKSFSRKNIFVVAGWDDLTKQLVMILRAVLKLPYAFWTDSLQEPAIGNNSFTRGIKKYILNGATVVMTTGNFGIASMKRTGLLTNNEKLVSLPFFVPIPAIAKQPSDISDAGNRIRLLVISRLIEGKGIQNAIRVTESLLKRGENIELQICGVGNLQSRIQAYIGEKNLEKNVFLLEWQDQNALLALRKKSHFLLHLVDEVDPFPLAVLESLAIGLPVIGSAKAGSVSDRVVNEVNGFVVDENNIETITDLITSTVKNPLKYNRMVDEARSSAEYWTAEKGVDIVRNVYTAMQAP